MDPKVPEASRAAAEAAAWLSRLRSSDVPAADAEAFQRWLNEDGAHAAAFEHATAIWDCVGGLADELQRGRVRGATPLWRRRSILAGAGTLALAAAGAMVFTRQVQARVYETEIGEQKHVQLADGSQLFLDTGTRIQDGFSGEDRIVDLQYGRADFTVAPRPTSFVVRAAGRQIIAGGAEPAVFDVTCDSGRLCIVALRGQAIVKSGVAGVPMRVLNSGDRLVAIAGGDAVDRPDLAPLTAWQSNQAIFRNETLGEAIGEMNRYSTVKLRIEDPAVAAMRISGVYRVGNVAAFAGSVTQILPVAVYAKADEIVLVRGKGHREE